MSIPNQQSFVTEAPSKLPRMRKFHNICADSVKEIIRENGKHCTNEFLAALDFYVAKKVRQACECHNGGRKRLDATVAGFVGIR